MQATNAKTNKTLTTYHVRETGALLVTESGQTETPTFWDQNEASLFVSERLYRLTAAGFQVKNEGVITL